MTRSRRIRMFVALATVLAVVAVVCVVTTGFPATRVAAADRGIWVSNASRQAIGRVNTTIGELDTAVPTATGNISLIAAGGEVLVVDRAEAELSLLDQARGELTETVDLPAGDPMVLSDGTVVVVHVPGTGATWIERLSTLGSFDPDTEPAFDFGADSVLSLAPDGQLFAYSVSNGSIYSLDAHLPAPTASTTAIASAKGGTFSMTSVDGRWALLDTRARTLTLPDRVVDLSRFLAPGSGALLQGPATHGEGVLIASTGGLVQVPLAAGAPSALLTLPVTVSSVVAPTTVEGCTFAAWGDGTLWRRCGSEDATTRTVPGLTKRAALCFRTSPSTLVINDEYSGEVWTLDDAQLGAEQWSALLDSAPATTQPSEQSSSSYDVEKTPQPPVAVDDEVGVRPGRSNVLPVLLNDSDSNGDALVIASITVPAQGTATVVSNGQQVQVTLPDDASGTFTLGYTIDDGRGGAAAATVSITVRSGEENSPPVQVRASRMDVAAGGRGHQNVLSDWMDPDADPFYLANASGPPGNSTSFDPSGVVTFADGTRTPTANVSVLVSDGRASGSGTVAVAVHNAGEVPVHADAFTVRVEADREATVSPLEHVKGGASALMLSAVPSVENAVVTPDLAGGTFRFRSSEVGSKYVEYTVTDGQQSTRGLVRVDVVSPPDPNTPPVTVPHTAFVRGEATSDLDVLAQDSDPAGGVLVVTGVSAVPEAEGVQVQVLDEAILRVSVSRSLGKGTLGFRYSVTNGLASAEGEVTIVQVDADAAPAAPLAVDDSATVRVGSVVDIPVLANDSAAGGGRLVLAPGLVRDVPPGSGLLFVEGDRLRFLAPQTPGTLTASYRVEALDGQWSTAQVTLIVREVDILTNVAPVPETLTARVYAGQTVRIPVPLSGIDPDGDAVRLLGQQSSPDRGSVTAVDAESITYRAADYAAGTDTFRYTVVDGLGARATGVIRVGIASAGGGYRQPLAVNDEADVRPGIRVTVRVLANDVDPDGSSLQVSRVSAVDGHTSVWTDGEVVTVEVPQTEGRYGFVYDVVDEHGGGSSAFLSIIVSADAPLAWPVVPDRSLGLSEVVGHRNVDIEVFSGLFFADGGPDDLSLATVAGFDDDVTVIDGDTLRVPVRAQPQVIPFAVSRRDAPEIVTHAFVFVAGSEDSLPQLRAGATALTVPSGETLTIRLSSVVVAAIGRQARIVDPNTVMATHSDGTSVLVDSETLRYRSADGYYGPASLSFDVTDDASETPSEERTATIVLPIEVTPTTHQPPRFVGTSLDVEPGSHRSIDLARLTSYPYPDDLGRLGFSVAGPAPVGASATVSGHALELTVDADIAPGNSTSVLISVSDGQGGGTTGRIELHVVSSTRPLAAASTDRVVVPRGGKASVDLVADDEATNPFPGTPLRVAEVTGLDAGLPSGLTAEVGATGSIVTLSAAANAIAGTVVARYRLVDATGDPARSVWGRLEIVVQDHPEAVTAVALRAAADRSLTVSWTPGADNAAPITGYRVEARSSEGRLISTTRCLSTSCVVSTLGNGPDNAVRISVIATNAVGDSPPASLGDVVWSDVVPETPADLRASPLDGGFRLSWSAPPASAGGSAISSFLVTAAGQESIVPASGGSADYNQSFTDPAFVNGTPITVSVSARNLALPYLSVWNTASVVVTPYGAPAASMPAADADRAAGAVTVSWAPFDPRGDGILGYIVQRVLDGQVPTGEQACTVSSPAPGRVTVPREGGTVAEQVILNPDRPRSWTFSGLSETDTSYAFVVWGYNDAGCVASAVVKEMPRPSPGRIEATEGETVIRDGVRDYALTSIAPAADRYEVRAVDARGDTGPAMRFALSETLRAALGSEFGATVRFQVRACAVWGSYQACGTWSDTLSGESPSITFRPDGLHYDNGRWTWTAPPPNGFLTTGFACGSSTDPSMHGTVSPNGCSLPKSAGEPWLDATVDGSTYRFSLKDIHDR